jgi:hypothetical protein
MARAQHVPTDAARKQVEAMAAYGIPEWDIARVLGIDKNTLRKYYRDELDTGHIKANTKVAQNLFRIATGEGREAVVAAIFWLKTRARWSAAPDVATPVEEEIGKKQQAQRDAVTAAKGTVWERILQ